MISAGGSIPLDAQRDHIVPGMELVCSTCAQRFQHEW